MTANFKLEPEIVSLVPFFKAQCKKRQEAETIVLFSNAIFNTEIW